MDVCREQLVKSAPVVQNPILKAQVVDQTQRLLETIERAPDSAVRTDALQKVGLAAAEAGEPAVLTQTVKSLEIIVDTEPQHAQRAREALTAINRRIAVTAK